MIIYQKAVGLGKNLVNIIIFNGQIIEQILISNHFD